MTNHEYLQRFQNLVDVASSYSSQLYDRLILNIIQERQHSGVAYSTLTEEQKLIVHSREWCIVQLVAPQRLWSLWRVQFLHSLPVRIFGRAVLSKESATLGVTVVYGSFRSCCLRRFLTATQQR